MKKLLLFSLLAAAIFRFGSISAEAASDSIELGKYPVQVVAKKNTELKDEHGNIIKTVAKGEKLLLQALKGISGVINYSSKEAYIPLTDVHYIQLVDGSKIITSDEVAAKLKLVSQMYPSLTKLKMIGSSVEGRSLYSLKVGTGKRKY